MVLPKLLGTFMIRCVQNQKHFRNLENNSGEGFDIAELLSQKSISELGVGIEMCKHTEVLKMSVKNLAIK